jgi:hypothetical protein
MSITGTIYSRQATATNDLPFQVDDDDNNVLTSINIHCNTNDVYYGNAGFQLGVIRANSVVWFDGVVRVSDLWFKNYGAGLNGNVVVAGVLRKV